MLTRAIKEARLLAAPAALIVAATAVALAWLPGMDSSVAVQGWSIRIAVVCFYLGTAILCALPFGAEFQERTLVLLLGQPFSRARLWFEKGIVLAAILVVTAALQYAALESGPFAGRTIGRELMFLAVMLCSTGFWTLLAGSTIGGVAFSLAALLLVEMAAGLAAARLSGVTIDLFAPHPAVVGVRAGYALLTAWFGWRMLTRFEVAGEGGGATVRALGGAAPSGLRCRPTGALRNLLRKELRLQQPAFLIAAIFAGCWLAAMAFFAVPPHRPLAADVVFTVLLSVYMPLAMMVAGTMSVCEDTTLGVRAWHLTLPVSSRTQWLLKLATTVASAATLAVGLPALLVALPGGTIQLPSPAALAVALGAIVIAFWASTLFAQTTRAAVAAVIALAALAGCAAAGWAAGTRVGLGSGALTWVMVRYQLSPLTLFPGSSVLQRLQAAALAIVLLVALRQSLAAFRRVTVDRRTIRIYAIQLAAASFAAVFIAVSYAHAAATLWQSAPVRELVTALAARVPTDLQPQAVSVAELEASGLLSPATRAWLSGSRITITSRQIHSRTPADASVRQRVVYLARVTFPNGQVFQRFVYPGAAEF